MNSKVHFRMLTIFDLDKVEDYLHEMHLKGWKFKSNRFGFFYFEQCQPDDVIYRVWNTSYLRKNEVDLQSVKDRGWEFVENCSYTVFRKATCDVDSNDHSFMDIYSFYLWRSSYLYELVSRKSLSIFLPYFCPLCPHDFLPNL